MLQKEGSEIAAEEIAKSEKETVKTMEFYTIGSPKGKDRLELESAFDFLEVEWESDGSDLSWNQIEEAKEPDSIKTLQVMKALAA